MLSSCLDIFEARLPEKTADHDFGLLQAIDDRLAMYGWLANTGVKFVVVVDMEGRPAGATVEGMRSSVPYLGIRDSDLRPAFRALHAAYIRLLRNPFYDPDEHSPFAQKRDERTSSTQITSPIFIKEVERIGHLWYPGINAI